MRRLCAGFFACVMVSLGTACAPNIEADMQRAADLWYRQDYVHAEQLYRDLLTTVEAGAPLDAADEKSRLTIMERLGTLNTVYLRDFPQAMRDLERLVRAHPNQDAAANALMTMADIQMHRLGDVAGAVATYDRLLAAFGSRAVAKEAHLAKLRVFFRLKRYEQSRHEADAWVVRWPEAPGAAEALLVKAQAFQAEGLLAQATDVLEAILAKPTESLPQAQLAALAAYTLGCCQQELGRTSRALQAYTAALTHHPNPRWLQIKIGHLRNRLRHPSPTARILTAQAPMAAQTSRLPPRWRARSGVERAKIAQQMLSEVENSAFPGNNDAQPNLPAQSDP